MVFWGSDVVFVEEMVRAELECVPFRAAVCELGRIGRVRGLARPKGPPRGRIGRVRCLARPKGPPRGRIGRVRGLARPKGPRRGRIGRVRCLWCPKGPTLPYQPPANKGPENGSPAPLRRS